MWNLDLQELLDRLIASGCLFIKKNMSGLDEYYIPYMMNDAVECYARLKKCVVTGDLGSDATTFTNAEYVIENGGSSNQKQGVIFSKENGERCIIWFENYELIGNLYNYGRLGHFWRPGNDTIRRLVYLIGTIYDKYKYLGKASCNELECETMELLGVAPLREFSPIDEDFAVFYDDDELEMLESSGVELLINIAKKNNANELANSLRDYKKILEKSSVINNFAKKKLISKITRQLADSSSYKVIMDIEQRIKDCSAGYQLRTDDYKTTTVAIINEKRDTVDNYIRLLGYGGEYPEYHVQNNTVGYDSVTVYEQQPFIIEELEYEGVEFKLFLVYRNSVSGEEKLELYDSIL